MDQSSCIIHYGLLPTSDKLVKLSDTSFETLNECKKIRESLGGENHHEDQCKGVPSLFDEAELYYHRECYQKFTYSKTLLKRKHEKEHDTTKTVKRISRAGALGESAANTRGIIPKRCMICSKERIKVSGKFQFPTKILTKCAEEVLKRAAHLRKDKNMIDAVTDVDLIAKEFSKHQKCYLNYTRIARKTCPENQTLSENNDISGNFDSVCNVIEELVLRQQKCVSMESIVSVYGINEGDRQQRYRLKVRLSDKYKEDLLFISHEKQSPQLVLSKECLEKQSLTKVLEMSQCNTVKKAALFLREEASKVIKEAPALPWPPTIESLKSDKRDPPETLTLFYNSLLSADNSHHSTSSTTDRLEDSFSQDAMYAISH
jgi:hypothetical protein